MSVKLSCFLFIITCSIYGQQLDSLVHYSHFTSAELVLGKTQDANSGFPDTKLQKSLILSFGNYNDQNQDEWAYRLRYPRTGISFAITDYGNPEYIGYSASVLPFMEFDFLRKNHKDLKMNVGVGASYFTNKYDSVPFPLNNVPENTNRAISTKITWAFKLFFHYEFLKKEKASWKVGAGYFHQSNGHTRLPNQGLNSFLFSVSRQSNYNYKKRKPLKDSHSNPSFNKSVQDYFTFRTGAGLNVLSEVYNNKKGVYTVAGSYGKIINKTFKIGLGFYYRYYEQYNNYIKNDGELVMEEYPHFQENAFKYATNYGVFITSEFLLGHIGFEVDLGYNIYKPFYEVEWQLNQGFYWEFQKDDGTTELKYILGELDGYYKVKKAISARLGLKYYLISNQKSPKSNVFIACHINANLGQADFTELSIGYVHRFKLKNKDRLN